MKHLIFDKEAKNTKWKIESIFSKLCWHNWISTCRRKKIDPYISPFTKLKFKWIKDLNIKPAPQNIIEEKMESTLEHIGTGDHFLNITKAAQILKETVIKWDLLKLKNFFLFYSNLLFLFKQRT